jgi:galactonate dehydratase
LVPIAPGERLVDRGEFEEVFRARAIDIAQPDLCHVGGFGEAKKIAAMAEAANCGIAPHNPLGPIAGVAALHLDIATPNFVIQEEIVGAVPWYHEVVRGPIRMVDGCWQVPEDPGLGIEVDELEAAKHPFAPEVLHTANRSARSWAWPPWSSPSPCRRPAARRSGSPRPWPAWSTA